MTFSYSTPAPLSSDDWSSLLTLLSTVHPQTHAWDYVSEYPLMLNRENISHCYGIKDAATGQLVCHIGTLRRTLQLDGYSLTVAIIGSVATHPEHRGTGLASQLLQYVHMNLRSQGIGMAFLWSDSRRLYEQMGYQAVGRAHVFGMTRVPVAPLTVGEEVRRPSEAELVYLSEPRKPKRGFERSRSEQLRLHSIPNLEVWVLMREGQWVAALYIGKGSDFPDIVHECLGERADIEKLLVHAYWKRGQRLGLLTDENPAGLMPLASSLGWPSMDVPQAQVAILDEALVRTQLGLPPEPSLPLTPARLFGSAATAPRPGESLPGLFPFHIDGLDCM